MKKAHFFIQIFLIISILISSQKGSTFNNTHITPLIQSPQSSCRVVSTTLTTLVVLMELTDDPHHPKHTVKHYEDLFFSNDVNSINQYYQNTSYGEVILEGVVLGWYEAEHKLCYYGAGERLGKVDAIPYGLAAEARTRAIAEGRNPENYDLFVVIHSGDGQEYSGNSDDIWSHKGNYPVEYSINHEFVDYVTPCHELGHSLNFPDLYDHINNQKNIYAGPYAIMAQGKGHFSIWNKYYSKISFSQSSQFLSDAYRLKITDFSCDSFITVNPLAVNQPSGVMWLELGWDSTGFSNASHGRGWTVTVRENLDFDQYLPKHGIIIAKIQVGPRTTCQVGNSNVYPPWNVIDAHPETSENKNDAAFSLNDGDVGTYCSGEGWAVQLIEKYTNLSYSLRVTNESNIPQLEVISPNQAISGLYNLSINISSLGESSNISSVEISIDNGPWQICTPQKSSENEYFFNWDTKNSREGTHLVRARCKDNSSISYVGYSPFITLEVDNIDGTILVVDDDLGQSSEIPVLDALDDLGFSQKYDVKQTTSLTDTEITAEEMLQYDYIIWVGNPRIVPISNSHINYNEFKEIKHYLDSSSNKNPSRIIFMSNYNIFDFSNQGESIHNNISEVFRVRSPKNFRAPVSQLTGKDFLEKLPNFTLGPTETLSDNRSSDGEVVSFLSGTVSILEDLDPEYSGFGSKGYYVDNGEFKFVNFLFQPEMVPDDVLPQLLNLSLNYLSQPNNATLITSTTQTIPVGEIVLILSIGIILICVMSTILYMKRIKGKESKKRYF